MLNDFDLAGQEAGRVVDLRPAALAADIDATNDWVFIGSTVEKRKTKKVGPTRN